MPSLLGKSQMPGLVRGMTAFVVLLLVLFPRYTPLLTLTVVAVALLVLFVLSRFSIGPGAGVTWLPSTAVTWSLFGFLAVVLVACSWSVDPKEAIEKVLWLTVIGLVVLVLSHHAAIWSDPVVKAMVQGFAIGLAAASVYIFIETVTHRGLTWKIHTWFPSLREGYEKHYPLNKHGQIRNVTHAVINRATFVWSAMLWPALLALTTVFERRWRYILGAVFGITAVSVVAMSTHQSSQLSIVASALVFLLAIAAPRLTRGLLAALVCALFALIVPFSIYAQRSGWPADETMHPTARVRLIYWGYTAEQVLKNPILGVGTHATEALDKARTPDSLVHPKGYAKPLRTNAHPHNSYLQLWYETGFLGVAAMLTLMLTLLWQTAALPLHIQRYALAYFSLVTLITLPSFGLWQTWFQAIVGFSILALIVASRTARPGSGASQS